MAQSKVTLILEQWYAQLPPHEIQRRVRESRSNDITLLQVASPTGFEEEAFRETSLKGQSFHQYCMACLAPQTDLDVFYAPISGRLYVQRGWPRYCDGCRGVFIFTGTCVVIFGLAILLVLLIPRHYPLI